MSSIGRLRKNAENYMLQDVYNKMTPEQYKQGINYAIEKTKRELEERYRIKEAKMIKKVSEELMDCTTLTINTISVELLYELAKQMNAFNEEDPEVREQIIDKVQEIYIHTMDSIKEYGKYKNDRQAIKEFDKKKKQIEKYFNIKF